jgi:hypothetical protein
MPACPDPQYISSPAQHLRNQLMRTYGLRIEAMDNLRVRSFVSLRDSLIGIRSGLDWDTLHWVCAQVAGREILERFGPAVAPRGAVVPIQRRRLTTIYDRFESW